ncbi:diguanylate cyclase domain-containing protein [uncultured Jatrophihabitans sp.]|uniref:diguanylate cyclase domain-containing protein n=1 Tax=uncultured Jatrophihabitans sp. TaxID=1610747 RepID=UPI0035CBFA32
MTGSTVVGFADAVLDALPDAMAVIDGSGAIVAVNRAWRMFAVDNGGRPEATGVGVNYLQLCERSAAAGCADAVVVADGIRTVLEGQTHHVELEYPCPSPAVSRWFLLRIAPLAAPAHGAVISHVNITRRKQAERELAHEAAHDPLTAVANRTLFTAKLTNALNPPKGRTARGGVGVLYLDLDCFKPVNDTFGHDAGDEVLLTTADRLRKLVRPQDTVARLGGDEFAVVAPRITAAGLEALAARITAALQEPHLVHGQHVQVPASVGAYLAVPGEAPATAMRRADRAMYAVKRSRRTSRDRSGQSSSHPLEPVAVVA